MQINPTTNKPDNWVKAKPARAYLGVSDSTWRRYQEKGLLPPAQYLNGVRVWRQSAIDKLEKRLITSDKPEPNNDQAYA